MSAKIAIYTSWFIFAVWVYIVLVYAISFLYFGRIKTKNTFYDQKALIIQGVILVLNLVGQVFTIYLYLTQGKDLIAADGLTTTEYWILLPINLVLVIVYLLFFLIFTNNLAVKMTDTKLYLPGLSVINSAFIKVEVTKSGDVILEYVYKHEGEKKWTEKLKFYHFFASTQFIQKNYVHFFDPEKNLAFFNLHRVTKSKDESQSDPKTTDTVADATVKEVPNNIINRNKTDSLS